MLDDDDDLVPLTFPGSATIDTPVEQLVGSIRDALRLRLRDFRTARNPDDAFRLLRSRAEQAGVFVLVLGNLGSYHSELSVDVFRGFALADEFAPFVVINPRDSAAARGFTLLHELVHLWLGEPGISGGDPLDPVEAFCNNVASSFLLPDEELATLRQQRASRDGGPADGRQVKHSLGSGLVELTSRLMASGALTTTKAARVLGVNPRNAHMIFAAG